MSILQRATESLRKTQEILVVIDLDLEPEEMLDLLIDWECSEDIEWFSNYVSYDITDCENLGLVINDIKVVALGKEKYLLDVVNKLKELDK